MGAGDHDCGPIYGIYEAARAGDLSTAAAIWADSRERVAELDSTDADRLDSAVNAGDPEAVAARAADLVFDGDDATRLDGPVATVLGGLLYGFGYLASFVLFFRAHSLETVVARLRWAYRTVGVDIRDTESVDGVERTTFRCPYRNLGAGRWGKRHVCHDVLDRVDDGYVTFLERHRDIDYQRPRACAASECCYSEVAEP